MYRIMVSVSILLGAAAAWAQPQLANPASVNCTQQGGRLTIERRPNGGEFGVCIFADNYQCEEWALLRGECPKTGLRVTGFATAAGRYCAITGGRYSVISAPGENPEQGICTLSSRTSCAAEAHYAGTCPAR